MWKFDGCDSGCQHVVKTCSLTLFTVAFDCLVISWSVWVISPSVLWHCWLGIKTSIRHAEIWVMTCWCGYLSWARCKWFAYGPADATASTIISCFIEIQIIDLTFLLLANPGFPGKETIKLGSSSFMCFRFIVGVFVLGYSFWWIDQNRVALLGVVFASG